MHIARLITWHKQKVVLFCRDFDQAKEMHAQLIGVEGAAKEWFYLLDLEETNPIEKGRNTRLFNAIEAGEYRKIECVITC